MAYILPHSTNVFFCEGLIFFYFSCLVFRVWENFKFLGELISFLGKWGEAIFFHKGINEQSCKLNNSWWQNYLLHANFSQFYLGIFFLRIFCLFKCPLKLSRKCLLLFGNDPVKVWIYCLIWALKKSILFGSNSLKLSVLCDMNSEKLFTLV